MKLHLGCGKKILNDYINIDCAYTAQDNPQANYVQAEIVSYLEGLKNDTVEEIKSEHFLEHLTRTQVSSLLYHSSRILKVGGIFDVLIPEFNATLCNVLFRYFVEQIEPNQDAKLTHSVQSFYGCTDPDSWAEMHKLIYDRKLLEHILSVYDFGNFRDAPVNQNDEIRIVARKMEKVRNFIPYKLNSDKSLFSNILLEELGNQRYYIDRIDNVLPTYFSAQAILYKTWFGIRRESDCQLVAFYDSKYYSDFGKIPLKATVPLIPFATAGNIRGSLSFDFSSMNRKIYNFGNELFLSKT